jgi:hypothetical protein
MEGYKKYIPGSLMIAVSLFFLIYSMVLEDVSVFDPAQGGFLPAFVSIIMMICGIAVLKEGHKCPSVSPSANDGEKQNQSSAGAESGDDVWNKNDFLFTMSYFGIVILFVLSLNVLPFIVAAPLFLCLSMLFFKGVSWKVNILTSIIVTAVIYILFQEVFQVVLP